MNLFETSLMFASEKGHIEIVQLLLKQEGFDINAKNNYLFYSMFVSIIGYFKIIFGFSLAHFTQHSC